MKQTEFNPKERPDLMFDRSSFVRYRNGKEVVLEDLTIREIVQAMETPKNRFFIEEE
jgi:hypothetical protein